MEREHRPQFGEGLRAPASTDASGDPLSGNHPLISLDDLLEEELLPRQEAIYAPPREPPRETDHRTLHLRRVVIAPEADHRRQRTLLLRPSASDLVDPALGSRTQSRAPRRANSVAPGPSTTTLLLAVAAGVLLGAVAWLYAMGATRSLPLANLRQLAQASFPEPVAEPVALPAVVVAALPLPALSAVPQAQAVTKQPGADLGQPLASAARSFAPLPVVAAPQAARNLSAPVARTPQANAVKYPKRRNPQAPANPATRGTQKSWLGNEEPAAWVK
jgi:hypothetical protein